MKNNLFVKKVCLACFVTVILLYGVEVYAKNPNSEWGKYTSVFAGNLNIKSPDGLSSVTFSAAELHDPALKKQVIALQTSLNSKTISPSEAKSIINKLNENSIGIHNTTKKIEQSLLKEGMSEHDVASFTANLYSKHGIDGSSNLLQHSKSLSSFSGQSLIGSLKMAENAKSAGMDPYHYYVAESISKKHGISIEEATKLTSHFDANKFATLSPKAQQRLLDKEIGTNLKTMQRRLQKRERRRSAFIKMQNSISKFKQMSFGGKMLTVGVAVAAFSVIKHAIHSRNTKKRAEKSVQYAHEGIGQKQYDKDMPIMLRDYEKLKKKCDKNPSPANKQALENLEKTIKNYNKAAKNSGITPMVTIKSKKERKAEKHAAEMETKAAISAKIHNNIMQRKKRKMAKLEAREMRLKKIEEANKAEIRNIEGGAINNTSTSKRKHFSKKEANNGSQQIVETAKPAPIRPKMPKTIPRAIRR